MQGRGQGAAVNTRKRGPNRHLRGMVLKQLDVGPATLAELTACCAALQSSVANVLRELQAMGAVTRAKDGKTAGPVRNRRVFRYEVVT